MVGGIGCCDFGHMSDVHVREQILSLPEHARASAQIDIGPLEKAGKVCIFAFGMSSTAPDIVSAYADEASGIPVPVISDRKVPGWVDHGTQVIIVSHSGMVPELMDAYREVVRRGCTVHVIASGGDLLRAAEDDGVHTVRIPKGMTSRSATGFELGILCSMLQGMGVCDAKDHLMEVSDILVRFRDSMDESYLMETASVIRGNVSAVYGTTDLRAAYKRWKMAIDEDSCSLSFYGELPEFDHNELVGWFDSNPHAPELRIIVLQGRTQSDLLNFIVDNMVEILREEGRSVTTIRIDGDSAMVKGVCGVLLGDAVASMLRLRGGMR